MVNPLEVSAMLQASLLSRAHPASRAAAMIGAS